jgi:hypothetical protein
MWQRLARHVKDYQKFAVTRYGHPPMEQWTELTHAQKAHSFLRGLGRGYQELLVDPGLVMRFERFKRFVALRQKQGKLPGPWTLRDEFARSLGTRTVYRSLALTPAQYETIRARGMGSRARRGGRDLNRLMMTAENFISARIRERGDRKKVSSDPLLSVSEFPQAAVAAACEYETRGKRVYLFKLRVPEIDLIYEEFANPKPFRFPLHNLEHVLNGAGMTITSKRGRRKELLPLGRKLESFLHWKIDRAEIVSSCKVSRRMDYHLSNPFEGNDGLGSVKYPYNRDALFKLVQEEYRQKYPR